MEKIKNLDLKLKIMIAIAGVLALTLLGLYLFTKAQTEETFSQNDWSEGEGVDYQSASNIQAGSDLKLAIDYFAPSTLWSYSNSGSDFRDIEETSDGKILLADFSNIKGVIKIDPADNSIPWQYAEATQPIDVEELENGNILITDYSEINHQVIELDPLTSSPIWVYDNLISPIDAEKVGNLYYIADRGQDLIKIVDSSSNLIREISISGILDLEIDSEGYIWTAGAVGIVEFDSNGVEVQRWEKIDYFTDIELLANGHFLLSTTDQIIETDNIEKAMNPDDPNVPGTIYWIYGKPNFGEGAHDAEKISDGNILATDWNTPSEVRKLDGNLTYPYYALSGTLTSLVYDVGSEEMSWGTISWTETLPTGTEVFVAIRTGGTATPDDLWSDWYYQTNGDYVSAPANRYFQYMVQLRSSDLSQTPIFDDLLINYTLPPPPPDSDNDGVEDSIDNCPNTYNPDQKDADGDGIGDVCDSCPNDPNNDEDSDGVCGDVDNCPTIYNPYQTDTDSDGVGDKCDDDLDGDGVLNTEDNCKYVFNPDQADTDPLESGLTTVFFTDFDECDIQPEDWVDIDEYHMTTCPDLNIDLNWWTINFDNQSYEIQDYEGYITKSTGVENEYNFSISPYSGSQFYWIYYTNYGISWQKQLSQEPVLGKLSIMIYDDPSNFQQYLSDSTTYFTVYDENNYISVGLVPDTCADNYVVLDPVTSDWICTNVERTTGWHKLEVEINQTQNIVKIDNTIVYQADKIVQNIDWFGIEGPGEGFYDDLKFEVMTLAEEKVFATSFEECDADNWPDAADCDQISGFSFNGETFSLAYYDASLTNSTLVDSDYQITVPPQDGNQFILLHGNGLLWEREYNSYFGKVSIYVYDDPANPDFTGNSDLGSYDFLYVYDKNGNYIGAGFDWDDPDFYRIDINGDISSISLGRTAGWHKLEIVVDETSNKILIDDNEVYSTDSKVVEAISSFGPYNRGFFDNLEFYVVTQPSQGDGIGDACDICPEDPENTCNLDAGQKIIEPSTGGTVSTGDNEAIVEIPANALSEEETITIEEGPGNFQIKVEGATPTVVVSYNISPSGLVFDQPVTITIHYPSTFDYGTYNVYWKDPNGVWHPSSPEIGITIIEKAPDYIKFTASHFSEFGVGFSTTGWTQTDWSGGPTENLEVGTWDKSYNKFYKSQDIDWSSTPGEIKISP